MSTAEERPRAPGESGAPAESPRVGAALLAEAASALSTSLDLDATVAAVLRVAVPRFCDACILELVGGEGEAGSRSAAHADPTDEARLRTLRSGAPFAASARVLAAGQPELHADLALAPDDPDLRALRDLGAGSAAIAPMFARGRGLGALLLLAWGPGRRFGAEDLEVAAELAGRAALAIDNARLYGDARRAEERSRRGATRLAVLAEASKLFAESGLELHALLDAIARRVAETPGDACAIQLLSDDGEWLEPVALHHPDAEAREVLLDLLRARPATAGEVGRPVEAAIRSLFLPALSVTELRKGAPVSDDSFPGDHVIAAPLVARGRLLGSLAASRGRARPPYGDDDRLLVEGLAERAALAIENTRLYADSQRAVDLRDEFLSVAGHELRTPLTAMQLQLQSLARLAEQEAVSPRLRERASRAVATSARLARLVDELLDVSRMTSGRLLLAPEEMDLAATARDVIERAAEQAAGAGCEIRLTGEAEVWGRWDRARIEQVVVNLLANAIKYGEGRPVEVRVEADGRRATLAVRDRGIGIAPQDQARIFGRFERAVSSRRFTGLGIGLWIVRQLVEAHGGSVQVESAPGEGAAFRVELPRGSGEA